MFTSCKTYFFASVWLCLFASARLCAATPPTDPTPIHEAFVPKFTDPIPLAPISQPPPAALSDIVPPQSYSDAIWIPGYWSWLEAQNDFVWICGVWRRPPIGHFWISGSWNHSQEGWVWARGFWSHLPLESIQYIKEIPPSNITEKIPPSPGSDYFWASGYWNYTPNLNKYIWFSGKWVLSNPDWVLAPASYIWRPFGYVFVTPYWDWALEDRGTAYSCEGVNEPLVGIEPDMVIQQLFLFYPDYISLYWHWWHYHPGWGWDACGCVPPWWLWHDWWFFSWADSWGLWWWWGHPGVFPPFWLPVEFSLEIAPPPLAIVESFKQVPKSPYNLKLGNRALLPKGIVGRGEISPPVIPNNVIPGGQIVLPVLPAIDRRVPLVPLRQKRPQLVPVEPIYPTQVEYYPQGRYRLPIRYPIQRRIYYRPYLQGQRGDFSGWEGHGRDRWDGGGRDNKGRGDDHDKGGRGDGRKQGDRQSQGGGSRGDSNPSPVRVPNYPAKPDNPKPRGNLNRKSKEETSPKNIAPRPNRKDQDKDKD